MDKDSFNQAVGIRLRTARKGAKRTQVEAASALGCVRAHIANLEAGYSAANAYQLAVLAALYGRPAGYFYGEATDSPVVATGTTLIQEARAAATAFLAWTEGR